MQLALAGNLPECSLTIGMCAERKGVDSSTTLFLPWQGVRGGSAGGRLVWACGGGRALSSLGQAGRGHCREGAS